VLTINSIKILHAVRSAITAIAELLVLMSYGFSVMRYVLSGQLTLLGVLHIQSWSAWHSRWT